MTAPAWFERNLAEQPDRGTVQVDGCAIETLAWGVPGTRGLLLVHGNGAHADWWVPFGPFFSADWRVGAFSLSGMGRSGWRDHYSMSIHVNEMVAVAEILGLFEGDEKPWVIAHSLGGIGAAYLAASDHGERFAGIIIVDSGVVRPQDRLPMVPRTSQHPGYATIEDGVARFRVRPTQPGIAPWLLEFLGERSLYQAPDGRWYWRFDPDGNAKRNKEYVGRVGEVIPKARCPLSFVWGEHSAVMTPQSMAINREVAPRGTRFVEIPDAHHQLMLDQPLAFVAAVRGLLA